MGKSEESAYRTGDFLSTESAAEEEQDEPSSSLSSYEDDSSSEDDVGADASNEYEDEPGGRQRGVPRGGQQKRASRNANAGDGGAYEDINPNPISTKSRRVGESRRVSNPSPYNATTTATSSKILDTQMKTTNSSSILKSRRKSSHAPGGGDGASGKGSAASSGAASKDNKVMKNRCDQKTRRGSTYDRRDQSSSSSTAPAQKTHNDGSATSAPRYMVDTLVGRGAFAELYKVYCTRTQRNYAVKVEKNRGTSKLEKEANIQRGLDKALNEPERSGGRSYVPRFYGFHNLRDKAGHAGSSPSGEQKTQIQRRSKQGAFMVLELLGRDLSRVRKMVKRHKLSICSVGFLGKQLIHILRKVHAEGVIHRDIKPQNCMLGNDQNTKLDLHLVDFGLAREDFYEEAVGPTPASNVSFRGTAAYASLRSLENIEQAKRDDLEGVFWVFADLLWGGLPWRRLNLGKSRERDQKIRAGKLVVFDALQEVREGKQALQHNLPADGVFAGPIDAKGNFTVTSATDGISLLEALPPQMITFLNHLTCLEFDETPRYDIFEACFTDMEQSGDTDAFRKHFQGRHKEDAISREIHGDNTNKKFFNGPSDLKQLQAAAALNAKRQEQEEQRQTERAGEDDEARLGEQQPEYCNGTPTPGLHHPGAGRRDYFADANNQNQTSRKRAGGERSPATDEENEADAGGGGIFLPPEVRGTQPGHDTSPPAGHQNTHDSSSARVANTHPQQSRDKNANAFPRGVTGDRAMTLYVTDTRGGPVQDHQQLQTQRSSGVVTRNDAAGGTGKPREQRPPKLQKRSTAHHHGPPSSSGGGNTGAAASSSSCAGGTSQSTHWQPQTSRFDKDPNPSHSGGSSRQYHDHQSGAGPGPNTGGSGEGGSAASSSSLFVGASRTNSARGGGFGFHSRDQYSYESAGMALTPRGGLTRRNKNRDAALDQAPSTSASFHYSQPYSSSTGGRGGASKVVLTSRKNVGAALHHQHDYLPATSSNRVPPTYGGGQKAAAGSTDQDGRDYSPVSGTRKESGLFSMTAASSSSNHLGGRGNAVGAYINSGGRSSPISTSTSGRVHQQVDASGSCRNYLNNKAQRNGHHNMMGSNHYGGSTATTSGTSAYVAGPSSSYDHSRPTRGAQKMPASCSPPGPPRKKMLKSSDRGAPSRHSPSDHLRHQQRALLAKAEERERREQDLDFPVLVPSKANNIKRSRVEFNNMIGETDYNHDFQDRGSFHSRYNNHTKGVSHRRDSGRSSYHMNSGGGGASVQHSSLYSPREQPGVGGNSSGGTLAPGGGHRGTTAATSPRHHRDVERVTPRGGPVPPDRDLCSSRWDASPAMRLPLPERTDNWWGSGSSGDRDRRSPEERKKKYKGESGTASSTTTTFPAFGFASLTTTNASAATRGLEVDHADGRQHADFDFHRKRRAASGGGAAKHGSGDRIHLSSDHTGGAGGREHHAVPRTASKNRTSSGDSAAAPFQPPSRSRPGPRRRMPAPSPRTIPSAEHLSKVRAAVYSSCY
ncbi:unnamed protein product [Amoebophrya sp. A25]|nr:unnamed protein product [Amoebophrya sp. A25]|eukprot:GSA25T00019213001.1